QRLRHGHPLQALRDLRRGRRGQAGAGRGTRRVPGVVGGACAFADLTGDGRRETGDGRRETPLCLPLPVSRLPRQGALGASPAEGDAVAAATLSPSSSSEASTRSMACRLSPSPSRIRVTPWVLRPTWAISEARVRTSVP